MVLPSQDHKVNQTCTETIFIVVVKNVMIYWFGSKYDQFGSWKWHDTVQDFTAATQEKSGSSILDDFSYSNNYTYNLNFMMRKDVKLFAMETGTFHQFDFLPI